jgi:hypothetical protein
MPVSLAYSNIYKAIPNLIVLMPLVNVQGLCNPQNNHMRRHLNILDSVSKSQLMKYSYSNQVVILTLTYMLMLTLQASGPTRTNTFLPVSKDVQDL